MKLEPIAKPIKIRIKIGDNEYSDFDSVKSHFSAKELYPLFKDGRLERWLRQIGKDAIAKSVQDISQKCGDGSIQDYILFLSVFFDEIAAVLNGKDVGKEIALDSFLTNISLDLLKNLFRCTKDIEGIEWKDFFNKILSKSNYKEIFENELLHTVYSDKLEWGIRFSLLVKTKQDYKEFFDYIEAAIKAHPEYEEILSDYFNATYEDGYCWEKIYRDRTVQYLSCVYQHKCLQDADIKWGEIFSESVQNWDTEHETIETILKTNEHHLNAFYECCAKKGIKEAKNKLDPWAELVNSEDYKNIMDALEEWEDLDMHYNKNSYNYSKMKSPLGKEILDFLQSLTNVQCVWSEVYSDSFLENLRKVMVEVRSRKYNKYNDIYKYIFSSTSLSALIAMQGITELATFALSNRNGCSSKKTYTDIATEAVKQITNKLKTYKS